MKKTLIFAFLISILIFIYKKSFPQNERFFSINKNETFEALVEDIIEEKLIKIENSSQDQIYQKIKLLITSGSIKGRKIIIENNIFPSVTSKTYKVGDKVLVSYDKNQRNEDFFYIVDYVRREILIFLFIIFIFVAIIVAGKQGINSLIGMSLSFFVIFYFILPSILKGKNPILTTILGAMMIVPITFSISHGFNKKTLIAVVSTIITLVITGFLAFFSVEAAKLSGFSSEEANFVQILNKGIINIKDLLLAGIIISLLGILDDITISQSSIVFQLKKANPRLKLNDLYQKAMAVGKDHISALINTLVLVYTGTSLPILILFLNNSQTFTHIINYEIVAEEIIKTLMGSIGLILAVPITTFIASIFFLKK